ncbi:MAG: insulinase family protein [Prevotella sp.]|nr:insulinase family protein [Prevotella sp.]
MEHRLYTLENGLRVVHVPTTSPVVYLGYRIAAGTRNEQVGEEGLAHLCEHATFKGTQRRRAWQIMSTLERVGGDLNAFTTKEDTTYHAAVLREHTALAVDLLTDIVFHSVYPDHEIEKEKEVVCDEIESYNDSPAELIYDEFENILFANHPLGHNILGSAERVRSFTSADVKRFTAQHYRPDNAVLFIYGTPKGRLTLPAAVVSEGTTLPVDAGLSVGQTSLDRLAEPVHAVKNLSTHQAHVMLGQRAYPVGHPLSTALFLLNNMLGGPGMNARLNMSLRERHGLVYTVESSLGCYRDTATWAVYFGCDPKDVDRCIRLVKKELQRFVETPLSQAQLRAACRQLKGQLGVACDSKESFALDLSKSFLHQGKVRSLEQRTAEIDLLTPEQLRQAARETFDADRLCTLVYK